LTVSIIIPSWNGRALLEVCLGSVRRQTLAPLESIVVDNGSDDGSARYVRERFPEVSLVELESNRGFAAAVNEGIRRARGAYVAFLNNDVEVEPSWLAELVSCAARHPRAAGVAPKLLEPGDERIIDRAGDVMTSWFRAYPRGEGETDRGQYEREVEVFGASGAASLWNAEAVQELGLLDDDLFFSYEDVDLSFRARLAGYECWYAPRAVAFHAAGTTSGRRAEFTYLHATRNRWSVIVKDVPGPLLARNAHRIVLAELLTVARCTRERRLRYLSAAYVDALRSLPRWLERRREVQATRSVEIEAIRRALTSGYPTLGRRLTEALIRR
jgi:GT2 family glycosyltransferase